MRSPYDVLKKPVITERSMDLAQENKYTFVVEPKANKIEIKHAVEQLFNVKVLDVHTMNVKGKPKRMGKYAGRTADKKKAIVTLKEGDKIEIFEGV
ncbi:50S ribosomal protein l23 [Heliomicrobium modesticaldum Ice1]|uniref:Large ribosomal subunit protein uL23 n=1 Tax=Heliobacterium modesticaldum (strain ATCC 51547 / Ice1) TaxID=498761 RepID=RL23_HELMI|nr:50S ribosomal protein L23 [Heliomicrobium modesticaldum]B0TC58.1 RecName: Full=Large ribosomal subunit protein uL23; AltName: Full=50S ribosomal protein L23 [Heliomicrobium modesticaldum Ice1]ABZ83957.1 50S ribosomal protein l23 [Heliomicrobium modesticaldum Ice1]